MTRPLELLRKLDTDQFKSLMVVAIIIFAGVRWLFYPPLFTDCFSQPKACPCASDARQCEVAR